MRMVTLFLLLANQLFSQSFYTPREIYDFSIGDTLEFYISGGTQFTQYQHWGITRHSITDKIYNSDSSEVCYVSNTYSYQRNFNSSTGMYDTIRWSGTDEWCYTHLDSNLTYLPAYNYASYFDSVELANFVDSNCLSPSPVMYNDTMDIDNSFNVSGVAQIFTLSESCLMNQQIYQSFRPGFGKVKNLFSIETSSYVTFNDTILSYMVKNGVSYGIKDPYLSIKENSFNPVFIIQNPVVDLLKVSSYQGNAILFDAIGKRIGNVLISENGADVSFLELGYYFLKLEGLTQMLKFYKN